MKRNPMYFVVAAVLVASLPSVGTGQPGHHPTLHVNPRWKQCSFQLDPSLTQSAWHRFTQEAGLVAYFRPLTDARPLGRGRFELSAMQWVTGVDDMSSAWNDTFVHPDSTHWLTEGSGLGFPGVAMRAGVTDNMDAGAYFTKNPQANYGFYGAQVQYNLLNNASRNWAAAARASFVSLYGPTDLKLSVYGMDVVASRSYVVSPRWLSVSPYVGASAYLSSSHERTPAVNLRDEQVGGVRAMVGVAAQLSRVRLGVEYNTAKVQSTSFKIGVGL